MAVVEQSKHVERDHRDRGRVVLQSAGGERVLMIVDDLDGRRFATFRAALAGALAASDRVHADLSSLPALDPLAIRELLRAQALAARLGKSFAVVEASPGVRRSLDIADAVGLLDGDAR